MPAMSHRLIHEPRSISDFHSGIRGIREQFISARLRQSVCSAFDEAICRPYRGNSIDSWTCLFLRARRALTSGAVFRVRFEVVRARGALTAGKSSQFGIRRSDFIYSTCSANPTSATSAGNSRVDEWPSVFGDARMTTVYP
jgi:hypothetical protein